MHSNPNLLPLHRSSSNEDYRYGTYLNLILILRSYLTFQITITLLVVVDLLQPLEHLAMTCKVNLLLFLPFITALFHSGGTNHLMNPMQVPSAAYNPMGGSAASQYGHAYGSVHHQAASMHGLPPNHVAGGHMHSLHSQAQQQTGNPHMMSVQNGPVILVSNLNEDVSINRKPSREYLKF